MRNDRPVPPEPFAEVSQGLCELAAWAPPEAAVLTRGHQAGGCGTGEMSESPFGRVCHWLCRHSQWHTLNITHRTSATPAGLLQRVVRRAFLLLFPFHVLNFSGDKVLENRLNQLLSAKHHLPIIYGLNVVIDVKMRHPDKDLIYFTGVN